MQQRGQRLNSTLGRTVLVVCLEPVLTVPSVTMVSLPSAADHEITLKWEVATSLTLR